MSKNSQFEVCSTVPLDINGSRAGILDFGEDIVSKAGSDSGGTSSHDGSKNDTDSVYITEPSITSTISSSFHVIISNIDSGEKRLEVHISV